MSKQPAQTAQFRANEAGRNQAADDQADNRTLQTTLPGIPDAELQGDVVAAETDNSLATLATDFAVEQGEGRRISTAFAMKAFLPSQDWINTNVVSGGMGTHKLVGRIYGTAVRAVRKTNLWQGKQLESIALEGMFETTSGVTGEVRAVSVIYLPRAFALQIEAGLSQPGVTGAPLDVDIGLEATGKVIAYEWTVISYLEGRAERAMRTLRHSRSIGQPARTLLAAPNPTNANRSAPDSAAQAAE